MTDVSIPPAVGSTQCCTNPSVSLWQMVAHRGWWELKPRVMCKYCWQQVAALSVPTKEAACFVPHLDFGKKRNFVCLVNHLARMFC